jgi:hypothetical protein
MIDLNEHMYSIYALSTVKFALSMLGMIAFDVWCQYRRDCRELRK